MSSRSIHGIIHKAQSENRKWEYLIYAFCIVILFLMLWSISLAVYSRSLFFGIVALFASALFAVGVRMAKDLRKETTNITLFEAALSNAHSAEEVKHLVSTILGKISPDASQRDQRSR